METKNSNTQMLMMMLATMSSLMGEEFAIEKKTGKVYVIQRRGEEIRYSPTIKKEEWETVGNKKDFLFVDNQLIEPYKDHIKTIDIPYMHHTDTIHEPYMHHAQKSKINIEGVIETGRDGERIIFNSSKKENMISHKIQDVELKMWAKQFEEIVVKKLMLGISAAAKRNTHNMFLKYVKIINSKNENKLLELKDLQQKLNNSIVKSKTEKTRTTSRLNEHDKESIREEEKQKSVTTFKIQLFAIIGIVGILALIFIFVPGAFTPTGKNVNTVILTEQVHSKKIYTSKEILSLIDIISEQENVEIFKWRRLMIISDFQNREVSYEKAINIIKTGFTKEY